MRKKNLVAIALALFCPVVFLAQQDLNYAKLSFKYDLKGRVKEIYFLENHIYETYAKKRGNKLTLKYFHKFKLSRSKKIAVLYFDPFDLWSLYDFPKDKTAAHGSLKGLLSYFCDTVIVATPRNVSFKLSAYKEIVFRRNEALADSVFEHYNFFNTGDGCYPIFSEVRSDWQDFYGYCLAAIQDSLERRICFFRKGNASPVRVVSQDSLFNALSDQTYYKNGLNRSTANKDSTIFFDKKGKVVFVEKRTLIKMYEGRLTPYLIIDQDTDTVVYGNKKINVEKFFRKKFDKLIPPL